MTALGATTEGPTPGPWEPRQNESGMYVTCVNDQHVDSDGDPTDICSIENEDYYGAEQAWANCRLLAASQELLDVLIEAAEFIDERDDDSDYRRRVLAAIDRVLLKVQS